MDGYLPCLSIELDVEKSYEKVDFEIGERKGDFFLLWSV